jgi:tetratricopeptide (TPR) repeat protein
LPTEEQLLEIHRLAVLGGASDIAQDVTGRLADSWLGVSRFREVRDLCTRTLKLGKSPATINRLARAKQVLGDMDEALQLYLDALKIYEDADDRVGLADTLNNIGIVYRHTGEPAKALEYYQQALPLREAVGDRAGLAPTLNNIGVVYNDRGERAKALEYYQQALSITEGVGDRAGESVIRCHMAMIYREQGKLREAVEELRQVVALDEQVQSPDLVSDSAMLAQVEAELGMHEE